MVEKMIDKTVDKTVEKIEDVILNDILFIIASQTPKIKNVLYRCNNNIKQLYYEKIKGEISANPIMSLLVSAGYVKHLPYKTVVRGSLVDSMGNKIVKKGIPKLEDIIITYPEHVLYAYVHDSKENFLDYITGMFMPYYELYKKQVNVLSLFNTYVQREKLKQKFQKRYAMYKSRYESRYESGYESGYKFGHERKHGAKEPYKRLSIAKRKAEIYITRKVTRILGKYEKIIIHNGHKLYDVGYVKTFTQNNIFNKTAGQKEILNNLSILGLQKAREHLFSSCGGFINYTKIFYGAMVQDVINSIVSCEDNVIF